MSHHNTVFQQLLNALSRHEFESLARVHHEGQKLRKITRWDQFIAMAMSQLSGRQSLRDIEANLKTQRHKLYHLGAKPIAKSSLARVNEKQPFELYQALFYKLLDKFEHAPARHKFRFNRALYSLDSSIIDLSIKLFPWASCHKEKAAVKLHIGLNHGTMVPEFVALSDANEHDLVQARRFEYPKGSIIAMDRAYLDYGWYKSLAAKGIYFVTRLRMNAIYSVIERREVLKGSGVTSDQTIQLDSIQAKKQGAPRLRRVGYRDPDTGKHYVFLTNQFSLSAKTISMIYKDRWQVELFFKMIKQNLKIKAFVGTSQNAVLTQLWIAMCTYLLLAFTRFASRTKWSIQRAMRVLQLSLFERRSLIELLNPRPPDRNGKDQLRFAL